MNEFSDPPPYKWKTVRVFISSTFRDFHAERDYLIKYVFPELRHWCEQYKLHLVDIDLRWGVTEKEAESGKVIELCLEQIDGCRPFFICMLGSRYGWIPNEIERSKVAEKTLKEFPDLKDKWENLSVTHLEILHAALSPLHGDDPVPHSFFYFRDEKSLPGENELKSYTTAWREKYLETFLEEDPEKIGKLANLKREIEDRFKSEKDKRIFTYAPEFDTSVSNPEDDRLKGRFTSESLSPFGDRVKEHLLRALKIQFEARIQYLSEKREDSLENERDFHEAFVENRTNLFIGRRSLLQRLHDYAGSDSNKILAVYGEPGSGKSALLAKFYRDYKFDIDGNEINPEVLFIPHFIGASPSSTSIHSMLSRFCEELLNKLLKKQITKRLQEVYGDDEQADLKREKIRKEYEIPYDPSKLRLTFKNFLEKADGQVIILIDGLNQLNETDRSQKLDWLPGELPGKVKIIASTLEGKAKDSLKRITPEQLEVGELDHDERRDIIREMPSVFAKTLEDKHIDILLKKRATSNPLYLKVALEELRIFGSFEKLEEKISVLPDTVIDIFASVLERLEKEMDAELVAGFFCLLECSRYGLSANELENLLHDDKKEHFVILRQLRDYFISKDGLLDFFHRGLSKAVRYKYDLEHKSIHWHKALARFFEEQPHFFDGDKQKNPNVHKCLEQPWQETKGELWDELTKSLCDLNFIQAKCAAKHTYDLVNDYNLALESIPDNADHIEREKELQARLTQYVDDLILYLKGKINELEIPESHKPRSDKEIKAEIERIKTNPTRADRLKEFFNFLGLEADNLQSYASEIPHLATQQAWNHADNGAVAKAAEIDLPERNHHLLLLTPHGRPPFNPFPQKLKTLKGHTSMVYALSMTPDGRRAVSGSYDGLCILWDLNTGEAIRTLEGHTEEVHGVSIAPDGKMAISCYKDETSILWDLNTGEALKTLKGQTARREAFKTLREQSDWVNSISTIPDGREAVSRSKDKTRVLNGIDKTWVRDRSITPDGRMALLGYEDRNCILWDLDTGENLKTLKGHTKGVNAVAITPDGRRALSASEDITCILWDLENGFLDKTHKEQATYSPIQFDEYGCVAMTHDSNAVAITPDGRTALSGSSDGTSFLWDLDSGKCINTLKMNKVGADAVVITPDGKMAFSAVSNCMLWDLGTGKILKTLQGDANVFDVAISPDGRRGLSGSRNETCTLWDLETGTSLKTLQGHTERVRAVAITPDGKMALSASRDKNCILWDLEDGKILNVLKGHTYQVNAVAITPDGRRAVSVSNYGMCILWDLKNGRILKTLEGHRNHVKAVAITPDGKMALSGSRDMSCILWDLESGEKKAQFFTISSVFDIKLSSRGIVGGNTSGEAFILHAHRDLLCPGIGIVTARQIWDFNLSRYQALSADCPYCGHRFSPSKLLLETIEKITNSARLSPEQSPCLELPEEAWNDPGLFSKCPQCGEDLKFNPFIVGNNEQPPMGSGDKSGSETEKRVPKKLFDEGIRFLDAKENDKAIRAFKEAIGIKPDYAEAYNYLGVAYRRSGRHNEALEAFKKAIAIHPDYQLAYFLLGGAYHEKGQKQKARGAYKNAVRLKEDDKYAHFNLGLNYKQEGSHAEAKYHLKRALELGYEPARKQLDALTPGSSRENADSHYQQGEKYWQDGKMDEAIQAYMKTIGINPDHLEGHFSLGNIYLSQNKLREAMREYEEVLRIDPENADAYCASGIALGNAGHQVEAISAYEVAIQINEDHALSHYNLGLLYLKSGEKAKAKYHLKRALDLGYEEARPYLKKWWKF